MQQSNILSYLEKKVSNFKVNKRGSFPIFTCPVCHENEVCRFIPGTDKIDCMACGSKLDFSDLMYLLEDVKFNDTKESLMDRVYKDLDIQNDRKTKEILEFYSSSGWNLTPITKKSKAPFELEWTSKEHRDIGEWIGWLESGLNIGVQTGNKSSITIVDIDQDVIPTDIDLLKGNPLIQKTARGWHLIYKYVDLPSCRIKEYETDVLNDGKQAIIYPSVVVNEETKAVNKREFITPLALSDMPEDLYKLLKSKIEYVEPTEDNVVDVVFDEVTPINITKGSRNEALTQLGGILSKQLNTQAVEFSLNVLNTKLCVPPLPQKELKTIVRSLDKYIKRDEKALSVHIFKYLNVVEFANAKEIKDALGYPKEDVDKALAYLVMEQQLVKRGRTFSIIKKAAWKQELSVNYNAIDFELPYFSKYVNIAWGDMILLGSKTKSGKTTVAVNILKYLKDAGVKNLYYIGSEAGSRFTRTAMALGLNEGDFKWDFIVDPTKITLEPNAVTVLDWLMIPDKAMTDSVFKHFADQLYTTQGLLIAFQQLKENNEFFAPNMAKQFPSLAARYIYTDETGLKGNWHLDAIREPKIHCKAGLIPCTYDPATRTLKED